MSDIKKYQAAMRHRANPRYLRRDFIVPLYTGTEPDIVPETSIEQQGMVVDPSRILPKNFTDDMPFVTDKNNPEDLELAGGGSVERQGFAPGGIVTTEEFAKKQKFFKPGNVTRMLTPGYGVAEGSKIKSETRNIFIEALSKSGITYKTIGTGNKRKRIFEGVNKENMDKFEEILRKKVEEGKLTRSRIDTFEENKLIKKFISNKKSTTLPEIYEKFPFVQYTQLQRNLPKNLWNKIDVKGPKSITSAEQFQKINTARIQDQLAAAKYITDKISKGEDLSKKELSKVMNVSEGAVEGRLNNLIANIYKSNSRESNKGNFLKVFNYDERNNIVQALFNSKEFKNLYSNRLKADINNALPENSVLREEALKKLNSFIRVKKEIEKRFGDVIELEHPLARNIILSASRAPGLAYLKVIPVPKQFNAYKNYFDTQRGKVQRKILETIDKGEDTTELVKELKSKEKAMQTLFGNYDIGKISSKGNIIRYGSKSLFQSDLNQLLKDNLTLVDNLKNNINLNKENLTTLFNEAKLNVKALDKALELKSPKVTTTDIDNIINKIENVKTKSALDIADELSKEDARAVCGKLNLGGLPKGCAELAKEDPEKFIKTAAETTKNTSLATKAKQTLNFFSKVGVVAEEFGSFGRGVAGRTLGPLVALNSALEQWTAGNIGEGFRQIGDFLDPSFLIGDPLDFEKSRQEGSIQNIRSRIGEENQKSFNRILEYKDAYDNFQRVNSKLESFIDLKNNPSIETPPISDEQIQNLQNEKLSLEKILDNSKYANLEQDHYNVGVAFLKEGLSRNVDKPDSFKYTNETTLEETFRRAYGSNFYDLFTDTNEKLLKNKTTSAKIFKDQSKMPVLDNLSTFGGDVGPITTPVDQTAITPQQKTEIPFVEEQEELPSDYIVSAAEGGRIGLKEGTKIGRRGFLKFLAGAAAAPFVYKAIKGKKVLQTAKVIKALPPVQGMPEWFNPLVTRIMNEGIDISPKATRVQDIVKVKKLEVPTPDGKGTDTIVMSEYPDGRIEISADVYGGSYDSPFDLVYEPPKSDINFTTGKAINEPGDFSVYENRPKPDYNDPGNFEIDYEKMNVEDAVSDLERLEKIATGKRIPPQRVKQRTGARKFVEENPSDDIVNRYGDSEIEYDKMKDEGLLDD